MLQSLYSLVAVASIWLAVWGIGRPLARLLRLDVDDRLARHVWAAGLGLAALGWIFALVAACGLLHPAVLGLTTLAAAGWGLQELFAIACQRRRARLAWRRTARDFGPQASDFRPIRSPAGQLLAAVALVSTLAMLISALGPTASREALSQSLELAKERALAHALWPAPAAACPSGTLLAELWFQWALVLDGPIAAGLLQWSLGLLAAGATAVLAHSLLGYGAGIAAAFFLIAPGVQYQLGAPVGDLGAAAFAALAIAAWSQAFRGERPACWSAVAVVMLATALATKPGSIGVAAGIATATAWIFSKRAIALPGVLRAMGPFALAAGALALAWVLRPGSATVPATFAPDWQAVISLGILLVVLAPAAVLSRPSGGARLAAFLLAVSCGTCLVSCTGARWWAVIAPLAAVLAAHAWQEIVQYPWLPRRLAQTAIACLAALALGFPLEAAADKIAVALGRETREAYLLRRHPEFAAVVLVNRLVPEDGRLLADDRFGAYFHCRSTNAADGWFAIRCAPNSAELARRFRASGITHVLEARPDGADLEFQPLVGQATCLEGDAGAAELHPCAASSAPVLPLAEFRITRADATVWRYRLLQIR